MPEKSKILIVDDSRIFRSILESIFSHEEDMEILGSVWNGKKALELFEHEKPDFITLDVEMPEMDGIEMLRRLQDYYKANPREEPVCVIMVSHVTREGAAATVQALELGAYDFVEKSEAANQEEGTALLKEQLLPKIREYKKNKVKKKIFQAPCVAGKTLIHPPAETKGYHPIKAVLIGISTGGPQALSEMLPVLSSKITQPIFIVQHMPILFTASLAESLGKKCTHTVMEAKDNVMVLDKHIYIAPGGSHLIFRKFQDGVITTISDQPPENGFKPSVDVMFRSGAAIYGGSAIGIIMTGMGSDGSQSLRHLKREGAYLIAQDEATSVVWGMPGAACATGFVDEVVPLNKIPEAVEKKITLRNKI